MVTLDYHGKITNLSTAHVCSILAGLKMERDYWNKILLSDPHDIEAAENFEIAKATMAAFGYRS